MKFALQMLPVLPATEAERETLRPIGHRTEKWQAMLKETVEIAKMAEDLGFSIVHFPEHHLNTEGVEQGGPSTLDLYVAMNTSTITIGRVGWVLPTWNPVRLAIETAWLDQLTQGRIMVGLARGYQSRWFNIMTQHVGIRPAASDQSEHDELNRKLFYEAYEILKLAWSEEAFSYKGEFYEIPSPYEGVEWPPAEATKRYGHPEEIGGDNLLHKVSVVPKPYQKPHPPLFQAFSVSENTIRWTAREGITPVILIPHPTLLKGLVEAYQEEAAKHGRELPLGKGVGVLKQFAFGRDEADALRQAREGSPRQGWAEWLNYWGFHEAFRLPGEETPAPQTLERMVEADFLYAGSVDQIRRKMDGLAENVNPEYVHWWIDQGLLPLEVVKRNLRLFGEKILPHYLNY